MISNTCVILLKTTHILKVMKLSGLNYSEGKACYLMTTLTVCINFKRIESFPSRISTMNLMMSIWIRMIMNIKLKCGVKKLGPYSDLNYALNEVLLADVCEQFRNVCPSKYKLYPTHYLQTLDLAWYAMLKLRGVEFELHIDYDMHLMVEMGIRVGISQCVKRYLKMNNKHLYLPTE